MDALHFDSLATRLADRLTRRGSLGLISGLGLGAFMSPAVSDARKGKKKKKKACAPCKKRKKGKCKANLPDGTGCENGGTCQSGACVPRSLGCGEGGPCLAFLSSTLHQGDLGGTSGADAKCQAAATAAKLPGTYKAWLSDSFDTSSPSNRFVHSTGPYKLINGATVAASWDDLTDGVLAAPINVTEKGDVVTASNEGAWTNTQRDGTRPDDPTDCDDWQSRDMNAFGQMGLVTGTNQAWTEAGPVSCQQHAPLYCFQQS